MSTLTASFTERYELLDALTGSALFAVYRGRERSTGTVRVIKVPRAHVLEDPTAIDLFRELMSRVQGLDHPAIAQVREVGGAGTDLWVASDMVDAPTVRDTLPEGMALIKALGVIAQTAEALDAVSQHGLYHGDINPRHVHVLDDGSVRLTDVGMAALAEAIQPLMRTALQTPLPAYLAPEVLRGAPPSAKSDIYSLGMLLYELVTGHLPFPGNSPATVRVKQEETPIPPTTLLNPALPQEMDELLARALAWEPGSRHASAADMAQEVRALQARLSPEQSSLIVPPARARAEIRSDRGRHSQSPPRETDRAESDRVTMTATSSRRVCPNCLTANPADATNCSACWRSLESVPVLSAVEGEWFTVETRRRARRKRLVRRALLALGVLAFGALLIYDRTAPPGLLTGAPTSTMTAAQGPSLWSSPRNGAAGTGSLQGAATLPTGTVRWRRELGAEVISSPAVAGGRVFFTTRDSPRDAAEGLGSLATYGRKILALDATDGRLIWQVAASGPVDSSPVVAGDRVFVTFRDSRVVSLDAATGETVWERHTSNPIFSWVTVDQGILYVLSLDGVIQTLDAKTGDMRWLLDTGYQFLSPPAVNEGRLVAPSVSRRVLMIDGRSGLTRLTYVTGNAMEGSAAVSGDIAIVGGNDRAVRAINIHAQNLPLEKTVLKWWSQFFIWGMAPFPPFQSGTIWTHFVAHEIKASPAISGNRVVVATADGLLMAFDLTKGTELWQTSLESGPAKPGAPIIINDTVFIGTDKGILHALDVRTGDRLWSMEVDGPIPGNPAFVDGSLYLVTGTGVVYAVD